MKNTGLIDSSLRVAVVHDWLVASGGAEKVLARILECCPQSELFTVVDFLPPAERGFLTGRKIHTSFIQRLPLARRHYRHYLPLMPLAVESFDLSAYDLIISSSFSVAKGVLSGPDQPHVSYVHSPMRYAWDLQHQYLREGNLERGVKGALARIMLHRMRMWDCRTANGVDTFVSNSHFIARRVWKAYRRDSLVIHPPVDTDYFQPGGPKEDFYVTTSRLVPYKRIGLIVEAFSRLPDRRLIVIGDGPDFVRVRHQAGPNVRLLGHQSAESVRSHLQHARAFVFAALEDFGIAPVEAQACGTPVIAYGKGGVRETVVEGRTGLFFEQQSVDSLVDAIGRFEARESTFSRDEIRSNALRFSAERFRQQFVSCVHATLSGQPPGSPAGVLVAPSAKAA
jgi:glycosyltransferase involved in cell wall biosynthesis